MVIWSPNIRYPGVSDHYAVIGYLKIVRPTPFKRLVTSRNLRAIDNDRLQSDIADWSSDVLKNQHDRDVCGLVNIYYNEGLEQILNRHAPLSTRSINDRPSAPWLTTEIRNARRERRRAERIWRKSGLTVHKDNYIKLRNNVKNN